MFSGRFPLKIELSILVWFGFKMGTLLGIILYVQSVRTSYKVNLVDLGASNDPGDSLSKKTEFEVL